MLTYADVCGRMLTYAARPAALVASCNSLLKMSSESSLGTTTLREKFMDMECELTAAHIAHKEAEIQLVENVFCAAS